MRQQPYVVGEMRRCADCGEEFPRPVHRRSYCVTCQEKRKKASEARHPRPQGYYQKKKTWIVCTERKKLPFCPVCHRYNGYCEHREVIYG